MNIYNVIKFILPILIVFFTASCGKKSNLNKFEAYKQFDKFLDSLEHSSPEVSSGDSIAVDNINGIKQDDFDFFQSEGYNIDLEMRDQQFDNNSVNEIKSKYEINSKFVLDTIQRNYLCYSNEKLEDSIKISTIYYVIGIESKKVAVITYRTDLERNLKFELKFNNLVRKDSIPKRCFSNMQVDSIKFSGRYIILGEVCQWQGANNIQCHRMGQMNWSEFQTAKPAVTMIRNQIKLTQSKIRNIIKVDYIDVLFEGNKTKALRMYYKFKLPKIVFNGSNTIIAYYVVARVRNRYVACVLSHFDDEAKEGELPPLLSEVMKLN